MRQTYTVAISGAAAITASFYTGKLCSFDEYCESEHVRAASDFWHHAGYKLTTKKARRKAEVNLITGVTSFLAEINHTGPNLPKY